MKQNQMKEKTVGLPVKEGKSCVCGVVLLGFGVDVGCVYEQDYGPDIFASDGSVAIAYLSGFSPEHDILNQDGERIFEGLHGEVPEQEVSPVPRHPYFYV